ncbi:MAG: flagellar hook-length control protein FliK [Myxococcaceae bacterium]|nr:flagellar hook-length control protein FliK [Myxococcaceae bacterium]
MSRVEDEREAARTTERLQQQKRAEEQRRNAIQSAESVFSRLVQADKQVAQRGQETQSARAAISEALKEAKDEEPTVLERHGQEKAKADETGKRSMSRRALGTAQERQSGDVKRREEQGQADKAGHHVDDEHTLVQQQEDVASLARGSEGRKSDARSVRETMQGRRGEGDNSKSGPKPGMALGHDKGAGKTDPDAGGKGGQGSGDKKGKGEVPAGFRFNPALMAPVPVAQKRDMAGSDRLRRIATEIAQKIVERVRVGKNALGRAEFQIDLRSDVLSGLKVKVSSSGGKIQAVFSGSDREVLKMLEEQADALKAALSGRGLTLEELKIEAQP